MAPYRTDRINHLIVALSGEKLFDLVNADPGDPVSVWRRIEAVFEEYVAGQSVMDRISALEVLANHFEQQYDIAQISKLDAASGFLRVYQAVKTFLKRTLLIEVGKLPIHIRDLRRWLMDFERDGHGAGPEAENLRKEIQSMEHKLEEYRVESEEESLDSEFEKSLPERIRWKGNHSDLVYLFQRLRQEGLLTSDFKTNPWQQLERHFADEDGNILRNLRQAWQNIQQSRSGKSRRGDEINEIISEVKRRSE